MERVRNALKQRRQELGLTQQALASEAGLTRQALHNLESGGAVPSTLVALKLARTLRTTVEALFWLGDFGTVSAELALSLQPQRRDRKARVSAKRGLAPRVILGFLEQRWVAHALPASEPGLAFTAADGLLTGRWGSGQSAKVELLRRLDSTRGNLLVAGCAPALGLLAARASERFHDTRMFWLDASSERALEAVARGHVHVAGAHLTDERTGEPNAARVKALFPDRAMALVTLAHWEEGFVVRPGNPLKLRSGRDLTPRLRVIDRDVGTGAHALLQKVARQAKVPLSRLHLLERVAAGHMEVAQAVAMGAADVGIAIEAAAIAHGMDFVPLAKERFDLVLPAERLGEAPFRRVVELLQSTLFRRELESLGGYDTKETGEVRPVKA